MIKNNIVIQNNQHLGDIKVNVNYYLLSCNCSVCTKFAELSKHQKEKILSLIDEMQNKRKITE